MTSTPTRALTGTLRTVSLTESNVSFQVADYAMAAKRMAWVINGPSRGDNLQPFAWSQFHNISHIGLPPVYNFDFILMKPHL